MLSRFAPSLVSCPSSPSAPPDKKPRARASFAGRRFVPKPNWSGYSTAEPGTLSLVGRMLLALDKLARCETRPEARERLKLGRASLSAGASLGLLIVDEGDCWAVLDDLDAQQLARLRLVLHRA